MNIRISFRKVVRKQIWGEIVCFIIPSFAVYCECNSERIIEIGPHLPKLSQKICGMFLGEHGVENNAVNENDLLQTFRITNFYLRQVNGVNGADNVRCSFDVCVCVCMCARSGLVNQTSLKRLKLRTSNLTSMFPGTVQTWSLEKFTWRRYAISRAPSSLVTQSARCWKANAA